MMSNEGPATALHLLRADGSYISTIYCMTGADQRFLEGGSNKQAGVSTGGGLPNS